MLYPRTIQVSVTALLRATDLVSLAEGLCIHCKPIPASRYAPISSITAQFGFLKEREHAGQKKSQVEFIWISLKSLRKFPTQNKTVGRPRSTRGRRGCPALEDFSAQ